MDFDDRLLNQPGAAEKAGALNEARRNARRPEIEETGNAPDVADRPKTLRQAVQLAKRTRDREEEKAESGGLAAQAGSAAAPISKATGKLLQQAWLNLVSSFGLSLIWIDIHVFLGAVFGHKFFCKLGAEWLDNNIQLAQAEYAKKQGKMIGTVEPMGLACCNIGCLLIFVSILCLIAMLVGAVTNPLEALKSIFGSLWGAVTDK
ncbi:MAG: hypothetical protein WC458_01075 [Patescibacteria group bacterium]